MKKIVKYKLVAICSSWEDEGMVKEVNRLIKQFNQMKIMIKKMKDKKSMNLPFNFG